MSSRKTTLEQHPRNTREIASGTVALPIATRGARAWGSKVNLIRDLYLLRSLAKPHPNRTRKRGLVTSLYRVCTAGM